jgi:uncharacterized coiled-coil protein SlyX
MIDYLDVRRSLIYIYRNDLKDFGVHNPSSINHILFSYLKEISLLRVEGAKDIALRCFNNAYYICTLIQLEDFPELRVADYEQKLLEENKPFREDVCAASMAMVCKLLTAYDAKWRQEDNDLIKTIQYRFSHFQWMHIGARTTFFDIIEKCKTDGIVLPRNEFSPRDIIEAINNVREEVLASGAEYICERLALLDTPRKRISGADMAIARMNDYIREMEEIIDGGYPSDAGLSNDYDIPYLTAIEYITEHYPEAEEIDSKEQSTDSTHKPKTEDLQAQISELESKLTHQNKQLMEANNINTQQATRIKELDDQVTELQQKLSESGREQGWIDWLDDDVFKQNINAEEVYKTLCTIIAPNLKDRPRCYVLFRVLAEIKGLKKGEHQKDILKWWNAHFNCDWHGDNQFKFTNIPENIKTKSISEWNNKYYYEYAQDLLKAFAWNKGRGEYEIKQAFIKKG